MVNSKMLLGIFNIILVLISADLSISQDSQPRQNGNGSRTDIRIWIGYSGFKMEDFNTFLESGGNKTISGGLSLGAEICPFVWNITDKFTLSLPMVGIEILQASSKTIHAANENNIIVNWNVPVTGFCITPEMNLTRPKWAIIFRPIGIGLYWLGIPKLKEARLTVTDRPGYLKVSEKTTGIISQAGLRFKVGSCEMSFDGGYRFLTFSDILQEPKEGFPGCPICPPVKIGSFPYDLDYSGMFFKISISKKF